MSSSDFDEFVRRQQVKQQEEAAFDPKQQLAEWLDYLKSLYGQVTAYLKKYIDSAGAHVEYRDVEINEESIGVYNAPEMLVTFGRSTVTFKPIGTMLIGSKGRVDVQGPIGIARLSLINKKVTFARQLVRVTVTVMRPSDPLPQPPPPDVTAPIEWVWKIISPPPEMKFLELTEETFFDMILAVANA